MRLKRYKLSYFYLASGMEGRADIGPELIIEAPSSDTALYIYNVITCKIYEGTSLEDFCANTDSEKRWGMTIEELGYAELNYAEIAKPYIKSGE